MVAARGWAEAPSRRGQSSGRRLKEIRGDSLREKESREMGLARAS